MIYLIREIRFAIFVPAEYGWIDLKIWESLHALAKRDEKDNVVIGNNVNLLRVVDVWQEYQKISLW